MTTQADLLTRWELGTGANDRIVLSVPVALIESQTVPHIVGQIERCGEVVKIWFTRAQCGDVWRAYRMAHTVANEKTQAEWMKELKRANKGK